MRAVVDTNVLISGLFWFGVPHALLNHARAGSITLILSPQALQELSIVLARQKFAATLLRGGRSVDQFVSKLRQLAEITDPPPISARVCRDPDDDKFLALAVFAQADCIVSGDNDLLTLRSYQSIPIVNRQRH